MIPAGVQVFVALEPVDMRYGFERLSGLVREVYFNQTVLSNAGGPKVWYTDPFGDHADTVAFPGSVKEELASLDKSRPWPPATTEADRGGRRGGGALTGSGADPDRV